MKVFLSLGMSDKTNEQIKSDLKRMTEKVIDILSTLNPEKEFEAFEICHNADFCPVNNDGPVYCLGEAIKKMDGCEIVFFYPDYSTHRGCLVEEMVAKLYNIKRIYLQE